MQVGDRVKIKNVGSYYIDDDGNWKGLAPHIEHGSIGSIMEKEPIGEIVVVLPGGYGVRWMTKYGNNGTSMCLGYKEVDLQLIEEKVSPIMDASTEVKHHKSLFVTTENHDLLKACIENNQPALLIGETGTGKTTLVRELAKEKKATLHRVSVNGSMGIEEILGKWLVKDGTTYWQDGILTTAMKEGHWIVFDEINAALPEILFTLHSLLDDDRKILLPEKDNEIVVPHKNFRFFATMNPPEEYAGTKDMNKALMSRFTAVLIIEVLDQKSEYALLTEEKKADSKTAEILVRIATALRDEKKNENIFYFCSTRDLVQAAYLVNQGIPLASAIKAAIINKMTDKEYQAVKKHFDGIIAKVEKRGKSFAEIEKEWATVDERVKEKDAQIAELIAARDGIKSETIKKILDSVAEVEAK